MKYKHFKQALLFKVGSYIKKIIYAIGAQPQPESLLALEKLASETNDTEIKKLALHQLEKRKELGR